jgi:hypothetical protein
MKEDIHGKDGYKETIGTLSKSRHATRTATAYFFFVF